MTGFHGASILTLLITDLPGTIALCFAPPLPSHFFWCATRIAYTEALIAFPGTPGFTHLLWIIAPLAEPVPFWVWISAAIRGLSGCAFIVGDETWQVYRRILVQMGIKPEAFVDSSTMGKTRAICQEGAGVCAKLLCDTF